MPKTFGMDKETRKREADAEKARYKKNPEKYEKEQKSYQAKVRKNRLKSRLKDKDWVSKNRGLVSSHKKEIAKLDSTISANTPSQDARSRKKVKPGY